MQQTQPDALLIITQLVQVIGWPTLVVLAWKVSRYISKFETKFDGLGDKVENLGTNHLHEVRDEIKELRQAILTAVATRK